MGVFTSPPSPITPHTTAATVTVTGTVTGNNNNNATRERIVETSESLGTFFISYHLRNTLEHHKLKGLPKHYVIPPHHPSELFQFVADVCTHLRQENTDFFDTLPDRMNLTADNVKDVYMSVCENVFTDDGVVNWGRVMSLLTLAATFAVHFTKCGQFDVVTRIPTWLRDVVDMKLADWIMLQGGWEDVRRSLSGHRVPSSRWSRVIGYMTSPSVIAMATAATVLLYSFKKGRSI